MRRVEDRSCSWWLALSEPAQVTALLWKGPLEAPESALLPSVGEGTASTRRIAAALHVVVVTADLSGAPLEPGALYSYDIRFRFDDGTTSDLLGERLLEDEKVDNRLPSVDPSAPLHLALGFGHRDLPTLLVPPSTLVATDSGDDDGSSGLRVAHASCRRPGGGSFDALAGLAELVRTDNRPHQLFLTGDQIYADDVASPFLPVVTGLAAEVAGGGQPLPGFPPDRRTGGTGSSPVTGAGVAGTATNLPPLRRKWLLWELAGFTGGDVENHLLTFPEFVAHYLLAWSPRVWRSLPRFEDVFTATSPVPDPVVAPWLNSPWFCSALDPSVGETAVRQEWADPSRNVGAFAGFNRSARHVARYAGAAPFVAQVLANTPTYMMFDDHEVADDWNLNGRWFARVHSRPWGRFVVRNGLLAFTLMQAWGNDPDAFKDDKPGAQLLDLVPQLVAPGSGPSADQLGTADVLLGFDPVTETVKKRAEWSFAFGTDDYRTTVLDTRTHRDLRSTALSAPNLVANLDEQLPAPAATDTRTVHLVVSPVPVVGPAVIEQLGQPLAQLLQDRSARHQVGEVPGFEPGDSADPRRRAGCGSRVARGAEKFDLEGWSADEVGFEGLLARMAEHGSVVVLSGDVHYACTLTVDRWDKLRPSPSRIIQCTASPTKNVFRAVVDQVIRKVGDLQRVQEVGAERLAWNQVDADDLVPDGARLSLARRARLRREPALAPTYRWPAGTVVPDDGPSAPDWRWRMVPLADTTTVLPDELRPVSIEPGSDALPDDQRLTKVAAAHRRRLTDARPMLRRLVFAPNFGTVTFVREADRVTAVHTIHTPTVPDLPVLDADSTPLPDGRLESQKADFGPHTAHRAELRTPADAEPPSARTEP